jgi:hypothetical protein
MPIQAIDAAAQREIIQTLCEKLKAHYVFPEVAEGIYDSLWKRLEDGDYADIRAGEAFADRLIEHLVGASGDAHLWVRCYPEPLPEHAGSLLDNPERVTEFRTKARLDNYGLYKVERLPGNVGTIDIRYFYRPAWGSGDTAAAAMGFLANADALIVDLRRCRGGNPDMVALISSYLFDGEPIHLNSLYWREEDFTQQYWTLSHLPGKRLADVPTFVVTSSDTFSAGEEFAYNLKALRRATIVGERTAGGAHPGSPHRLHPHFEAFIPAGRAFNPVTNDNWEGRGVTPDIPVPQERALTTAYQMALRAVIERLGDPAPGPSRQLLDEAQSALGDLEKQSV